MPQEKQVKEKKSLLIHLREWADALVIAYILAMFIRTYAVELFKIPTGSMTPTLVGDVCTEFDYDGNGEDDLLLKKGVNNIFHVFYKKGGKYVSDEIIRRPPQYKLIGRKFRERKDQIVVDKFAYWFKSPKRGDIVVFKVPPVIFKPDKPVYIKRAIGLPGDEVDIMDGAVYINGKKLTGEPYDHIEYMNICDDKFFTHTKVPEGHIFVLGDNSKSSLDSRAWGFVPIENLKGRAFFRYVPLKKISFLN
jgi:signal peptidase I